MTDAPAPDTTRHTKRRTNPLAGSKAPRSRNRKASPWTPLTALAAVIMALVGTMIGTGHHSPQLGIDLAGGTTMTMTAKGGTPSPGDMDTALQIMRNRVNGQGVSEAEVTKQGNNSIEVDLPGKNSSALVQELGQTAKLYFRVVVQDPTQYGVPLRQSVAPNTPQASTPSPSGASSAPSGSSTAPGTPSTSKSGSSAPSSKPSTPATPSGTTPSTQHRVADSGLKDATGSTPSAPSTSSTATASSKSSASTPSTTPSAPASNPSSAASPAPSAAPSAPATAPDGTPKQAAPDQNTLLLYETIDCTKPPTDLGSMFAANQFAVGCDFTQHVPYLLEPADVDGKDLSSASANAVTAGGQNAFLTGQWEVDLSFNGKGAKDFGVVTTELNGNGGQFAVDLDGIVYSAATVQQPITDGNAQITGTFTQKQRGEPGQRAEVRRAAGHLHPGQRLADLGLAGRQPALGGLMAGGDRPGPGDPLPDRVLPRPVAGRGVLAGDLRRS